MSYYLQDPVVTLMSYTQTRFFSCAAHSFHILEFRHTPFVSIESLRALVLYGPSPAMTPINGTCYRCIHHPRSVVAETYDDGHVFQTKIVVYDRGDIPHWDKIFRKYMAVPLNHWEEMRERVLAATTAAQAAAVAAAAAAAAATAQYSAYSGAPAYGYSPALTYYTQPPVSAPVMPVPPMSTPPQTSRDYLRPPHGSPSHFPSPPMYGTCATYGSSPSYESYTLHPSSVTGNMPSRTSSTRSNRPRRSSSKRRRGSSRPPVAEGRVSNSSYVYVPRSGETAYDPHSPADVPLQFETEPVDGLERTRRQYSMRPSDGDRMSPRDVIIDDFRRSNYQSPTAESCVEDDEDEDLHNRPLF